MSRAQEKVVFSAAINKQYITSSIAMYYSEHTETFDLPLVALHEVDLLYRELLSPPFCPHHARVQVASQTNTVLVYARLYFWACIPVCKVDARILVVCRETRILLLLFAILSQARRERPNTFCVGGGTPVVLHCRR